MLMLGRTQGWSRATPVPARRDLKSRPGRNAIIIGSATLVRSLLGSDVIDELVLPVFPVVVARGRRLFDGLGQLHLQLLGPDPFPGGVLRVAYRPHAVAVPCASNALSRAGSARGRHTLAIRTEDPRWRTITRAIYPALACGFMPVTFVMIADLQPGAETAFQRYESLVLPLLARHGGRLERRLRTDDALTEVHIVSFETHSAYESYIADEERRAHRGVLGEGSLAQRLLPVRDVA